MSQFCQDFLANFFSDLAVGAILGSFLAWWIGRRLGLFELAQQRKANSIEETKRAISYLEWFKKDVRTLMSITSHDISFVMDDTYTAVVPMTINMWDVVLPSGDVPKLLSPDVLGHLIQFYQYADRARRLADIVLVNPDILQANALYAKDTLLEDLEAMLDTAPDLMAMLDAEAKRLQGRLGWLKRKTRLFAHREHP